ncbi:MAG: DUF3791 domain-containing protein [Actinomycetes bacterium]|jgi:hypothetical protein|nr:DUF3791 domain-containing protein [Actinomycetes bacterium]
MISSIREQNLIVVAAIDRYAVAHDLSVVEVWRLFQSVGLLELLRENYEALHTQNLFEGAAFAEDYLAQRAA